MDMSFDDSVVAFGLDDEATVSPHFVRDEGRGFPTIPFEWSGSYRIKPLQPIRRCNIPVISHTSTSISFISITTSCNISQSAIICIVCCSIVFVIKRFN